MLAHFLAKAKGRVHWILSINRFWGFFYHEGKVWRPTVILTDWKSHPWPLCADVQTFSTLRTEFILLHQFLKKKIPMNIWHQDWLTIKYYWICSHYYFKDWRFLQIKIVGRPLAKGYLIWSYFCRLLHFLGILHSFHDFFGFVFIKPTCASNRLQKDKFGRAESDVERRSLRTIKVK